MKVEYSQIRRIGRSAFLFIPVFCLCFWASAASAVDNPVVTVQTGTNEVLQLLREYPRGAPSLRGKIRAVMNNYFDLQTIAKDALGPEWKRQSPANRKQFTEAFSRLLFNNYVSRIEDYSDQSITYVPLQQGGGYGVVRAYVAGVQNLAPIPIDYYLHLLDGKWKVYDVVVEGAGLVSNYREQFNSILARSSFDGLLQRLKAQNVQG